MPVQKHIFPLGWTAWSLDRMRPVSGVSVVSTSQLLHENTKSHGSSSRKTASVNYYCFFFFMQNEESPLVNLGFRLTCLDSAHYKMSLCSVENYMHFLCLFVQIMQPCLYSQNKNTCTVVQVKRQLKCISNVL